MLNFSSVSLQQLIKLSTKEMAFLIRKINDTNISYPPINIFLNFIRSLKLILRCLIRSINKTPYQNQSQAWVYVMKKNIPESMHVIHSILNTKSFSSFHISNISISLLETLNLSFLLIKLSLFYFSLPKEEKKILSIIFYGFIESKILLSFANKTNIRKLLILGYTYHLSNFFLSLFASKTQTIDCIVYTYSFSFDFGGSIICNIAVLNNSWLEQFNKLMASPIYTSEKSFVVPLALKKTNVSPCKTKIAFYSSGFYARNNHHLYSNDFIFSIQKKEELIKKLILYYAKSCPNLSFDIFLHPIENYDSANHFYSELCKQNNVSIKNEPSASLYEQYEIGLAYFSTTLFERLSMDLKSIFLFSEDQMQLYLETNLKHSFILSNEDTHSIVNNIEQLRKMPLNDYINLIH